MINGAGRNRPSDQAVEQLLSEEEAARIRGESLNYARQGQLAVRDPNFKPTVTVVDIPPPAAAPAANK